MWSNVAIPEYYSILDQNIIFSLSYALKKQLSSKVIHSRLACFYVGTELRLKDKILKQVSGSICWLSAHCGRCNLNIMEDRRISSDGRKEEAAPK